MKYYTQESICFAEYHTPIYGHADIQKYFENWFQTMKINQCSREIYELIPLRNMLIETGTFSMMLSEKGKPPFHYKGKYMGIWNTESERPTLISEIWGADEYIDRALVVFQKHENTQVQKISVPAISSKLQKELEGRNHMIGKTVKERDGLMRAAFFTDDAIFMPYFKPMLIGMEQIRSYVLESYNNAVSIDSVHISAGKILEMDTLVLEHGQYSVQWHDAKNSGIVTGKSINLWKRGADGKLMLYRQMVNHD
jgi:ketosteroid isomerase-like protein